MENIIISSIILLAKTAIPNRYIFGAYKDNGDATSFLNLPEDHDMFVNTLIAQQTIMGRETLEATPLDFPDNGRICVTHHPETLRKDAIAARSITEAITIAKQRAMERGQEKVFVIGGASIMKQCIDQNILDEVLLTLTESHNENVPHPVYLDFNLSDWLLVKDSGVMIGQNSQPENLKFHYYTLWKKD